VAVGYIHLSIHQSHCTNFTHAIHLLTVNVSCSEVLTRMAPIVTYRAHKSGCGLSWRGRWILASLWSSRWRRNDPAPHTLLGVKVPSKVASRVGDFLFAACDLLHRIFWEVILLPGSVPSVGSTPWRWLIITPAEEIPTDELACTALD
jgi:hypothetical protein